MNRSNATSNKPSAQPQPAKPPRNPTHSAKNQRSQRSSAQPASAELEQQAEQVEGEGSYTATHRYNEGVREHIQKHDVEREAEQARQALEGDERRELEQAEERGKAPAKR